MDILIRSLSLLAAALQVPVTVAILYLLVRGCTSVGAFASQWSARHQYRLDGLSHLKSDDRMQLHAWLTTAPRKTLPSPVFRASALAITAAGAGEAAVERALVEFELEADRTMGLLKVMTRIGPLLGLMGTLIPLGPALLGLSSGDISLLARKMEVAFSTTVTGLVIGAIGYLLYQVRHRWALDDLSMLEFIGKRLREVA